MSSAIETHRAIRENAEDDFLVQLQLAAVVKPADDFLKSNIATVSKKLESWKLYMQIEQPERYSKIERIVNNAEKNIRLAREKAVHIDHWVRFDMARSLSRPQAPRQGRTLYLSI